MPPRKPLRGKRFGKLVVMADVYRRGEEALCQCRCDCGKNVVFRRLDLSRGRRMSCGCAKTPRGKVIEKGQRFGRLTVCEEVKGYRPDKKRWFLCACDCGGENTVAYSDLVQGKTRSCGCLRKDLCRALGKRKRQEAPCHPA